MTARPHIIIFLMILVIAISDTVPVSALARTRYICNTAPGNGTGSSWTDAFRSFEEAGLQKSQNAGVRGDTFFVAGSLVSYGPLTLRNPSGAILKHITICKPTAQNHGAGAGWKKEYASQQAVFLPPLRIESDGWIIDGATGGGAGQWDTGYGFKIADTLSGPRQSLVLFSKPCSSVTLRHAECVFDANRGGSQNRDQDVVYAIKPVRDITFSFCAFKYPGRCHFMLYRASRVTVEQCYHLDNRMSSLQHAESWSDQGSDSITIRNNLFRGSQGTGTIVVLSRGGTPDTSAHWRIYGNVFDNGERGYVTDGVIAVINNQVAIDWIIANNTFIGIASMFHRCGISFNESGTSSRDITICNNVWINCDKVLYSGGNRIAQAGWNSYYKTMHAVETHGHEIIVDPLANRQGDDFRLSVSLPAGLAIKQIQSPDMLGSVREPDSLWNRGAVQSKR